MRTSSDQNNTIIGPDAHFKGEMSFDGSATILGTFDGTISSKGEIAVGEGATCNATVNASRVVVDGTINGDVNGRECVELNAGARIEGDIAAGNLVVVEGATFIGHCKVGPDAVQPTKGTESAASQSKATAAAAQPERPRIETRSMRPAGTASDAAAAPSAAAAAVARSTASASDELPQQENSWLRGTTNGTGAAAETSAD